MRTNGGWAFRCKDCWGVHLVPYFKLSEDPKQKVRVHIKCPKQKSYMRATVYERSDFQLWVGDEWVYENNVIEPDCIEKCK